MQAQLINAPVQRWIEPLRYAQPHIRARHLAELDVDSIDNRCGVDVLNATVNVQSRIVDPRRNGTNDMNLPVRWEARAGPDGSGVIEHRSIVSSSVQCRAKLCSGTVATTLRSERDVVPTGVVD